MVHMFFALDKPGITLMKSIPIVAVAIRFEV